MKPDAIAKLHSRVFFSFWGVGAIGGVIAVFAKGPFYDAVLRWVGPLFMGAFFLTMGLMQAFTGESWSRDSEGARYTRQRNPVAFWLEVVPGVGMGAVLLYFSLKRF
jgi:hypothetical protein